MRTCSRCGIRETSTTHGMPVCDPCKAESAEARRQATLIPGPRRCRKCGSPTDYEGKNGNAVCGDCRTTNPDGSRRRRPKVCRDCGVSYETSGGNDVCAKCRRAETLASNPCPDCGAPHDPRAERCAPCARRLQVGALSPGFKAAKRFNYRGYVMAIAPTGHPRARPKSKFGHGYVLEHHLVIEAVLGRYLRPGETIHHKNGVKHDNRPENLELWSKSHPAGQRVVDLLAWAREIIATYESEVDLLP